MKSEWHFVSLFLVDFLGEVSEGVSRLLVAEDPVFCVSPFVFHRKYKQKQQQNSICHPCTSLPEITALKGFLSDFLAPCRLSCGQGCGKPALCSPVPSIF